MKAKEFMDKVENLIPRDVDYATVELHGFVPRENKHCEFKYFSKPAYNSIELITYNLSHNPDIKLHHLFSLIKSRIFMDDINLSFSDKYGWLYSITDLKYDPDNNALICIGN